MKTEFPFTASGGSENVCETAMTRGPLDELVVAEVEDCVIVDTEVDEAEDG